MLGKDVVMDAIDGLLVFCKLLVCRLLVFSGTDIFGACMLPTVTTAVVEVLLLNACFTSISSGFDFLFFCFRAAQVFLCLLKTL